MHVEFVEWLQLLEQEYLKDFVRQGGAAVKFVVTDSEELAARIKASVEKAALGDDYLVAQVDAASVRIHLMQELFHQVARQIDWEALARHVVRSCYQELGNEVPETDLRIESVAELNRVNPGFLRGQMQRSLEGLLNRQHDLARDFRYAMLWMCIAQLTRPQGGGPDVEVVLSWLRGELRLISSAKKLLIFEKIGRHNARAMLSSLGAWCRLAGRAGLALILDIRQLAVSRRADAPEGTHHYSAPAAMDAYEVLRQLIDSTDDLVGVLAVVVAKPELFDDEKRGVKAYKALYERIWPDVRLRSRPNPLSALATLVGTEVKR